MYNAEQRPLRSPGRCVNDDPCEAGRQGGERHRVINDDPCMHADANLPGDRGRSKLRYPG